MSKKCKLLVAICAALVLSLCSVLCGCFSDGSSGSGSASDASGKGSDSTENSVTHTHSYSDKWSKDETNHWHACEGEACDEVSDKAAHVWNDGEVTTAATFEADGVKKFTCSVCGQTKTEKIDKLEHNYSQEWSKNTDKHWHACTDEGYETLKKDEAAHTFDEGVITTPATFEADGVKTLTCTVCGQTKTEKIDKLTHNYSEEWSKGEDKHWHVCTDEGYETLKKDEAAHTFNDGEVTTAATIDADGVKTFTCTVCGQTKTEKIDKLEAVTISFSGIERDSIRIAKGTTTTIEEPSKADNVFVSWTDADGNVVDVTAAFNADITLTANFKEGYDFKKNHAGATATTSMEGATEGTVAESSIFETGIRYNFPSQTSDSNYYVVTLPCINYSKFTVVAFNWKAEGWTQVGLKNDRGHMGDAFVGTLQVVKVGDDYKAIWMNYGDKNQCWETTISDTDIINGTKGLDYVYALTYSADRWLDIEVSGVSHVYNDGVLQRVAISENGDKIIRNGENKYDPSGNSGNWTVALQAIDYTKYASVTFNWNFSCEWARIGLNSVNDVYDSGTKMVGTLVISKNAEGQYVATLTNTSVEDGGSCTKVLSDDVANGKKGLVIYFGADHAYRQFNIDAVPTYAALPTEQPTNE